MTMGSYSHKSQLLCVECGRTRVYPTHRSTTLKASHHFRRPRKALTVFDMHQYRICVSTLRMPEPIASVMGAPSPADARSFLRSIGYTDAAIDGIANGSAADDLIATRTR